VGFLLKNIFCGVFYSKSSPDFQTHFSPKKRSKRKFIFSLKEKKQKKEAKKKKQKEIF